MAGCPEVAGRGRGREQPCEGEAADAALTPRSGRSAASPTASDVAPTSPPPRQRRGFGSPTGSAGTASPPESPGGRSAGGSGFGGTRTPADDFIEQRRKSRWAPGSPASPEKKDPSETIDLPPRVYLDNRTLIRQVTDLHTLQRGDHCLTAINLFRCASPALDHLISCLGSIELCYFYHHFLMMDDVAFVDEQGVPRNSNGDPAMLFECGNTVPEAYTELRRCRSALQFPFVLANFLWTCKAKYTIHPLADYGDTPHIYRVLDKQSVEQRERAVQEAERMSVEHKRYHVLFNNCEHLCNAIRKGEHQSANVTFMLWNMFRVMLSVVGLLVLRFNQDLLHYVGLCYDRFCLTRFGWTRAAFHLFTSVPVALQAMISFLMVTRSIWKQHKQSLIDKHELYHLLSKELGRVVVVSSLTIAVISWTPEVVSSWWARFVICASAYMASDVVYNCLAHAVMRCVLLPSFGRVWLLGPRPRESGREKLQ